jgi:hypothetical protein
MRSRSKSVTRSTPRAKRSDCQEESPRGGKNYQESESEYGDKNDGEWRPNEKDCEDERGVFRHSAVLHMLDSRLLGKSRMGAMKDAIIKDCELWILGSALTAFVGVGALGNIKVEMDSWPGIIMSYWFVISMLLSSLLSVTSIMDSICLTAYYNMVPARYILKARNHKNDIMKDLRLDHKFMWGLTSLFQLFQVQDLHSNLFRTSLEVLLCGMIPAIFLMHEDPNRKENDACDPIYNDLSSKFAENSLIKGLGSIYGSIFIAICAFIIAYVSGIENKYTAGFTLIGFLASHFISFQAHIFLGIPQSLVLLLLITVLLNWGFIDYIRTIMHHWWGDGTVVGVLAKFTDQCMEEKGKVE